MRAQKHLQANINKQNKIKQTLNNKDNNFSRANTSNRVKVACLAFCCFLCAQNLFVKKTKTKLEIVLIASFHYTADVYPYQPTYQASIYMHLLLFVTICENLFESLLIYNHLWESTFLSLYENKQTYEHHYLKQIFYHQNMIMFCWFRMFPFYAFCLKFFSFYIWVIIC